MYFSESNTPYIYDLNPKFIDQLAEDARNSRNLQNNCYNSFGFWPISFSYPRPYSYENSKTHYLSHTIPGENYTFFDEREYLKSYRESNFALSHRKAGFDCMRHLEILFSGCIPYIPDLYTFPKYTMTHYPKRLFQLTNRKFLQEEIPSDLVYAALEEWIVNYLSTLSMSKYMISKLSRKIDRVYFFDEALPLNPDYLSIMTLIGLKELYGLNCNVIFPVPYLYEGNSIENFTLYGRGFGYQGNIKSEMMNENEFFNVELLNWSVGPNDLLVVGSIKRNQHAIRNLKKFSDFSVYIYGEDMPISADKRIERLLNSTSATSFVREIL